MCDGGSEHVARCSPLVGLAIRTATSFGGRALTSGPYHEPRDGAAPATGGMGAGERAMTDGKAGSVVAIGGLSAGDVGISSEREARLDLLLAEELSVDHDLVLWFLAEAGVWRKHPAALRGELDSVHARVNYWDTAPDIAPSAQGETDLHLTLRWTDGRELTVLVEDKVWAVFQDRQPERYVERARACGGVAVLVAPASYLATHKAEAAVFDGAISVDAIADRVRKHPPAADPVSHRRARWRAQLLEELIRPRSQTPVSGDPSTIAFTEFCTAWLAERAPAAVPNPRSCYTAGQGWLWFTSPRGLGYKACGWARKPRAAVDLYVGEHGFDGTAEELQRLVDAIGLPEGFVVTSDTAKSPNVVLRYECDKVLPSAWPTEPDGDTETSDVAALEACAAITLWLQQHETRLRGPQPRSL
jgi:hypothetical protein